MYNDSWKFNSEQKTSGIYKITNTITNECYIGASKNVMKRKYYHKSNWKNPKSKEYNFLIYVAMRKYGFENFIFELLEKCEISELNNKERYYIKLYNPTYNQTPGGRGGHVNKPDKLNEIIEDLKENELTMKEIAKKYGFCEDTICDINFGKHWRNEELIYPIRKSNPKIISRRIASKAVIQFDLKGNFIKEWANPLEFGEQINAKNLKSISRHIYQTCRGERKTAFGFIWKFKN